MSKTKKLYWYTDGELLYRSAWLTDQEYEAKEKSRPDPFHCWLQSDTEPLMQRAREFKGEVFEVKEVETVDYGTLEAARKISVAAHEHFRNLLRLAEYQEVVFSFVNGRIVIAIHPAWFNFVSTEIQSWQDLRNWCRNASDESYFIVEGNL